MQIKIEIKSKPSHSKGWARYQVKDSNGNAMTTARTGNIWMSANNEAEANPGQEFIIVSQVMLRVGPQKREEIATREFKFIADETAADSVFHKPGSQGLTLSIIGARALAA